MRCRVIQSDSDFLRDDIFLIKTSAAEYLTVAFSSDSVMQTNPSTEKQQGDLQQRKQPSER